MGKKYRKTLKNRSKSNECDKCGGVYVGDDDEPNWISCDECKSWFHVHCTNVDKDISDDDLEDLEFVCESCV